MGKQLTVLFWGFIYGEVIGYIISALTGVQFDWLASGVICMIGGLIGINCLNYFISISDKKASK